MKKYVADQSMCPIDNPDYNRSTYQKRSKVIILIL